MSEVMQGMTGGNSPAMQKTPRKEKKQRIQHVGSYEVGKTLGNGSFGKVKLGTHIFTKEKVAIKFIKENKLSVKQRETCMREIEIMRLLDHPNIVKLLEVIEKKDDSLTFLVVEYVSGGELFDYIVAREYIKEKEARKFFRQIVSAIEYCHSNLVVHRDLKPENLLLDANGNIKITDFGLSNSILPGKLMDSFCGSPLYAAPEILKAEKYLGPPADIWSLGVILYAVLCGSLPWEGESQAEISYHSVHGKYVDPPHVSKEAVHIIRRMIRVNPKERATIEELKNHPWTNMEYNEPPQSYLPIREPVYEIKEELLAQLMSLGFSNTQETRDLILGNVQCRLTCIYHLLLDKQVQKEMEDIKKNMLKNQNKEDNASKKSLKTTLSLASIPEDEAGHQNRAYSSGTPSPGTPSPRVPRRKEDGMSSPSRRRQSTPKHFSPMEIDSENKFPKYTPLPSSLSAPANAQPTFGIQGNFDPSMQRPHLQLPSVPPPTSVQHLPTGYGARRRYSIQGPTLREEMEAEILHNTQPHMPVAKHIDQRQQIIYNQMLQQQQLQQEPVVQAPRTNRRMSLDSRMLIDSEDGPMEKNENLASPRSAKGIFKSSTTTTKSPEKTVEEVKRCLEETNLFTKKKGPYIFLCFDDENSVKFQIEIVKIMHLNLTGVQLKRISGDTWKYKEVCTHLVESIHI
ncbi:hypothetical protein SAMD00019534_030760 [Acytostelium subglobosum LB1]|uniref:hypothetical protein n=1 Tax=Acytostelium subglobosum LB1 TaxID=1410327 RepID=UPI0006449FB4|nr:hypothetical protein SAMD00019534_030760 [Acytostelium subglobosum LB1]GAM19901.1 hypothetical protein SAMD00019534_030760 [Acytostelium subglobosum LB1]|eukprot:XP_012756663.1 hypothetical protein SAMD00019534_030760 [Acytostelium subglobosum LB1]